MEYFTVWYQHVYLSKGSASLIPSLHYALEIPVIVCNAMRNKLSVTKVGCQRNVSGHAALAK